MTKELLLSASLCCALLGADFSPAWSQPMPEPWKEPQDTTMALFEPDRYAWRLFIALNWPANLAKKEADPGKKLGADGSVTWESWRSVNQLAPDTVFRPDGADPGEWLGSVGPVASMESQRFEPFVAKQIAFLPFAQRRVKAAPVASFEGGAGDEVRMNLSSFEFVRKNTLYNVEGQIAHFTAGKLNLDFFANSKLIKARWRAITESDKARYHWAEITRSDQTKEVWGLSALHIITKDLPNWFWATFEHIDTKASWQIPSVDRLACPQAPHSCEQVPAGLGLQGTKWESYRLRGSQIDFITPMGIPTVLSSSQLESPNQDSSCMTCHARATIDAEGRGIGFQFLKGPPQPVWFQSGGQRAFMQQDFVFSLTRAARKNP
jgi:hypothetical protein